MQIAGNYFCFVAAKQRKSKAFAAGAGAAVQYRLRGSSPERQRRQLRRFILHKAQPLRKRRNRIDGHMAAQPHAIGGIPCFVAGDSFGAQRPKQPCAVGFQQIRKKSQRRIFLKCFQNRLGAPLAVASHQKRAKPGGIGIGNGKIPLKIRLRGGHCNFGAAPLIFPQHRINKADGALRRKAAGQLACLLQHGIGGHTVKIPQLVKAHAQNNCNISVNFCKRTVAQLRKKIFQRDAALNGTVNDIGIQRPIRPFKRIAANGGIRFDIEIFAPVFIFLQGNKGCLACIHTASFIGRGRCGAKWKAAAKPAKARSALPQHRSKRRR